MKRLPLYLAIVFVGIAGFVIWQVIIPKNLGGVPQGPAAQQKGSDQHPALDFLFTMVAGAAIMGLVFGFVNTVRTWKIQKSRPAAPAPSAIGEDSGQPGGRQG